MCWVGSIEGSFPSSSSVELRSCLSRNDFPVFLGPQMLTRDTGEGSPLRKEMVAGLMTIFPKELKVMKGMKAGSVLFEFISYRYSK